MNEKNSTNPLSSEFLQDSRTLGGKVSPGWQLLDDDVLQTVQDGHAGGVVTQLHTCVTDKQELGQHSQLHLKQWMLHCG